MIMAAKNACNGLHVELFVPDFEAVKRFYGKLGFLVVWEEAQPNGLHYMIMAMGSVSLNFYGGEQRVYEHSYFGRFPWNTPKGYGTELIVPVENIEAYYQGVASWVQPYMVQPLALKPWGKRDFRIADPFGFYIRCTEPIDWSRPSSDATRINISWENLRVYVAYAIAGMESHDHGEKLVIFLRSQGFKKVFNPRETPIDHARDWRTADREEIRRLSDGLRYFIAHEVDVVVAHLDGASDGRAIELTLAREYGKPRIGFAPNPINSPWRFVDLTKVISTYPQLLTVLKELPSQLT